MVFDGHSDLLYDVTRRRLAGEDHVLERHHLGRLRHGGVTFVFAKRKIVALRQFVQRDKPRVMARVFVFIGEVSEADDKPCAVRLLFPP